MLTDLKACTTPQLHDLKTEFKQIMDEQYAELRRMRKLGAREDADGIVRHLDSLHSDIKEINEELTRRRQRRERRS